MKTPMSPLQVIGVYVGDEIIEHTEMVDNAISIIEKKISNIFDPNWTKLGDQGFVTVDLPNITQAALVEVAILFRQQGWKVCWRMFEPIPAITVYVPRD